MNKTLVCKNILIIFLLLFFAKMTYADSLLSPITDVVNSGVINTKIALDPTLSRLDINATVDHAVVVYSGEVNTDLEIKKLVQISQSVSGIKGVDITHLRVRDSAQPISDMQITAEIKAVYLREKLFGNESIPVISISVTTNNGIVSLTGTADNQAELNNAIKLAKSVKGVKSVESQVVIKR